MISDKKSETKITFNKLVEKNFIDPFVNVHSNELYTCISLTTEKTSFSTSSRMIGHVSSPSCCSLMPSAMVFRNLGGFGQSLSPGIVYTEL